MFALCIYLCVLNVVRLCPVCFGSYLERFQKVPEIRQNTHSCTHTDTNTQTQAQTHTSCTHIHLHTPIDTFTQAYMHTYTHTHTLPVVLSLTHIFTYIHSPVDTGAMGGVPQEIVLFRRRTHTLTHTHTHTHRPKHIHLTHTFMYADQ